MTEIQLQEEIKKALLNDIIPEIKLFKPNEMKVYLHDVPLTYDYEDDSETEKHFPCCVVRLKGGDILSHGQAQYTTIEILVIIKDTSTDVSGYQTVVITLNRIRDYLRANHGIHGKASFVCNEKYPLKWSLIDDTLNPYFAGAITSTWQTETKSYADIENLI